MTTPSTTAPAARRVPDLGALVEHVERLLQPQEVLEVDGPADLQLGGADLVVCPEPHRLDAALAPAVEALLPLARRALLLGVEQGSDEAQRVARRCAGGADLYPVALGDGERALLVLQPPAQPHPRDCPAATFDRLVPDHPDPLRLAEMRVCARETITFFADHEPRVWEYPSVANRVIEHVAPGGRVVDVGAGVSPMAPFLIDAGFHVETVDPSTSHRVWPPRPDWNEWDFLDYAAAGLAHASWNCTLDRVPPERRFDGVISVSVIEHLPAVVRRELIAEIHRRLVPGGTTVLTVDLERDGDALWNRNRGALVDDPAVHGTFPDAASELEAAGFELVERTAVRGWGAGPVDIGVLVARRAAG